MPPSVLPPYCRPSYRPPKSSHHASYSPPNSEGINQLFRITILPSKGMVLLSEQILSPLMLSCRLQSLGAAANTVLRRYNATFRKKYRHTTTRVWLPGSAMPAVPPLHSDRGGSEVVAYCKLSCTAFNMVLRQRRPVQTVLLDGRNVG